MEGPRTPDQQPPPARPRNPPCARATQCSQREAFLRDCKRPLSSLGPFWTAVHGLLKRLPGRAPPPTPQDAHVHDD